MVRRVTLSITLVVYLLLATTTTHANESKKHHSSSSSSTSDTPTWPIEHVVVLMFENRAFDHMLGFLMESQPQIEGLNGTESNPTNTSDPAQGNVTVSDNAVYVSWDPGHSIDSTTMQVFGSYEAPDPLPEVPPMNGFVQDAELLDYEGSSEGTQVMHMFNKTMVPVISELAAQFGVFNRWHASVPGPTEINRMYVNSATSDGAGYNDGTKLAEGYPQTTIFDHLDEAGISWGSYYSDWPTTLFFRNQREIKNLEQYHTLDKFLDQCADGTIPTYSFLEPRYLEIPFIPASDQHPSHSVAEGEMVMKQVYEALRASPVWNSTLFIITYDEHGGFYDHVPTPLSVPNPDGKVCVNPPFNFTRLGIRVPAIAISPWIDAGSAYGTPDGPTPTSQYEHSSVPATLKKMFGLPNFLTKRDAWAGTFESIVMNRTEPRTDCPETLPNPPVELMAKWRQYRSPITDFQEILVDTAAAMAGIEVDKNSVATEELAGKFLKEMAEKLIESAKTRDV